MGVLLMTESKIVLPGKEQFKETGASSFLLLLLVADLAFIFLHFLLLMTILNDPLYGLERDRGYPEFYQYVKEFWIIVLLLSICVRTGAVGYIAWVMLFGYLLCDDALQVHERFGRYIATRLYFVPLLGLRARDFGELAVSAMSGALLLTLLAWFYVRGSDTFKQSTKHLLLLLLTVAFFGIFVDMLHVALKVMGRKVNLLLGVVEDGGEMIAMSFVVWYVFLLNAREGDLDFSLRSLVVAALTRRSTLARDKSRAG
jgi:hypothetical protein